MITFSMKKTQLLYPSYKCHASSNRKTKAKSADQAVFKAGKTPQIRLKYGMVLFCQQGFR
jgi:hypothetical protein